MNDKTAWIYLSPHLDDAVLSCGGLIAAQVKRGIPVQVWTVCAGDPPPGELPALAQSLHERWQTGAQAAAARRAEDLAACALLGVEARHLGLPDCIYRRSSRTGLPVVLDNDDLFKPLHPDETPLIDMLAAQFNRALPADAVIISPLSIGGHVDHRLVRAAAERLNCRLWYYADFPYAASPAFAGSENPGGLLPLRVKKRCYKVSRRALLAWGDAVSAYASQTDTFWTDENAMRAALEDFTNSQGGLCLWASVKK